MDNALKSQRYHDHGWPVPPLDRSLSFTERKKNIKQALDWITHELNTIRRGDADLSYELMLMRITINEMKITRLTSIITQNVWQRLDMENYYDQVAEDLMMRNRTRTLPSNLPNNISDIICKKRRHASFTTDINDRYDDEKEISYDKEDPVLMDDFSFDETAF